LGESVENDIKLVLSDADTSIGNCEFELDTSHMVSLDSTAEGDSTFGSEFDGITNQVRDDLA